MNRVSTWYETRYGWEVKVRGAAGNLVAGLAILNDGMIEDVWVVSALRRQGIATEMLKFAEEYCPVTIWHDPRPSSDGEAWIRSLRRDDKGIARSEEGSRG